MLRVRVLIRDRPAPHVLDVGHSVAEAARFLRGHRIGGAPVVHRGRLVGFVSERDIVFRVVAEQLDPGMTTVADIMNTPVTTASIDDTVEACERMMRDAHVRHLPILDARGTVIDCLSLRDLLQTELRQAEIEVRCLTEYVQGA